MKIRVINRVCDLCGEPMIFNYLPTIRDDYGTCDSCGMPYIVIREKPISVSDIQILDPAFRPGEAEWTAVENYYTETENKAVITPYQEVTTIEQQQYKNWVIENNVQYI
jgi:hypothetical protein